MRIVLSQRRLAGEKPSSGFVADHHHARTLELILFAESSSRDDRKTTDTLVDGINAGKEQIGKRTRVMLNGHISLSKMGVTPLTIGTSLRM